MATQNKLEDFKINVKIKLANFWTSFMFLYIYVDYFHLYMSKMLEDIQKAKVFVFEISQEFLLAGLVSVILPALMILLSITLPAKVNRWTNISIGFLYIPYSLFNLVGEAWLHMYFGTIVEVILLCLIISYAWKWPLSEI